MPEVWLMIVRHDGLTNTWGVDEDSRHILEGGSLGGAAVLELRIAGIRPLGSSLVSVIALPVENTEGFEYPVNIYGEQYYIEAGGEIIGKLVGVKDGKVLVELS